MRSLPAVLLGLLPSAEAGWHCSPPDLPEAVGGVPLQGRRMLTDRETMPLEVPYANLSDFPKALHCREEEGATTDLVDLLRPVLAGESCGAETVFQSRGATLLRGLPLKSSAALSKVLAELNLTVMPYVGGVAPREEVGKGVMQASAEPPHLVIEPHWELSYAPDFPHALLFLCHKRPAPDGEGLTPITDGRAVLRDLRRLGLSQPFEERGVLYKYFYPSKQDLSTPFATFVWEVAFRTENRSEVDAFLAQRQESYPSLRWRWLETVPGGPLALEYDFRTSAVAEHPKVPGEQVWFNQVTAMHRSYFHSHPSFPSLLDVPVPYAGADDAERRYPFDTAYGDGGEISAETIRRLREVYWQHSVVFQWEAGDLLVLDNMVAAHARMDYHPELYERELFVSLLQV